LGSDGARALSTTSTTPTPDATATTTPSELDVTEEQLKIHALRSAVPMVGFGVVDCVVMTSVGGALVETFGAMGVSTMAAAACGLVASDSCGVLFGGVIEGAASKMNLPDANLSR
jgi:hypothetical protein